MSDYRTRIPVKHQASHDLPISYGYSAHNDVISVACRRCGDVYLPDQTWVDRMIAKGNLEPYEIERLGDQGFSVPKIFRQVVEVSDARLAYRWAGTCELRAGDRVLLPEAGYRHPHPWEADVVRIGSDYQGEMRTILTITRSVAGG